MVGHVDPFDSGHYPVSTGPHMNYFGHCEGWCPDHWYWFYDQGGEQHWYDRGYEPLNTETPDGKPVA